MDAYNKRSCIQAKTLQLLSLIDNTYGLFKSKSQRLRTQWWTANWLGCMIFSLSITTKTTRQRDNVRIDKNIINYRDWALDTVQKLTLDTRSPKICFNPNSNRKLWPFDPKSTTSVGYPKVIPCTKFEDFGIIHFRVIVRTNKQTESHTDKRGWSLYATIVGMSKYILGPWHRKLLKWMRIRL